MKKLFRISLLILPLFLVVTVSCNNRGTKQEKSAGPETTSFVEVSVTGMTCTDCENTVQASVGKVKGVRSVKASAATGKAIVEYAESAADTALIRKAIVATGYGVTGFNNVVPDDSIIK